MFKVLLKVFVANVTTQVVERRIMRGLQDILSPLTVLSLSDTQIESIAMEPASVRRKREFLQDREAKLKAGQAIFDSIMGITSF